MSEDKRTPILAELVKYTGRQVPASFVSHTSRFIPNVERFHSLIAGIYKPAWSEYALSIVMRSGSPYEHKDELVFLDDGRWLMTYSPRAGGLNLADNRALVKCMDERVPLAVFIQTTPKTDPQHGSTYRVLGLGLITNYNPVQDVFDVESVDRAALERVASAIGDEETRYELQLYAQLTNKFQIFAKEDRTSYTVSAPKRDEAFRRLVLREYDFTCAVCEMKFRLANLVEATAAHIVAKHKSGTDDPRNGLALCRTHHWAFDAGIFAIDQDYQVLLSPVIEQAETRNFGLREMAGKPILVPQDDVLRPHPDALAWHRKNVLQAVI